MNRLTDTIEPQNQGGGTHPRAHRLRAGSRKGPCFITLAPSYFVVFKRQEAQNIYITE